MNSYKTQATESHVHNFYLTPGTSFRKIFNLDLKILKNGNYYPPVHEQITLSTNKGDAPFFACLHLSGIVCYYAFVLQIKQPSAPRSLIPK